MPGWNGTLLISMVICAVLVYICLGYAHLGGLAGEAGLDQLVTFALYALFFFVWGLCSLIVLAWRMIAKLVVHNEEETDEKV